jgi:hypothetical protein
MANATTGGGDYFRGGAGRSNSCGKERTNLDIVGNAIVSSSLNFNVNRGGDCQIIRSEVNLNLDHTEINDLVVELKHNDEIVTLFENGCNGMVLRYPDIRILLGSTGNNLWMDGDSPGFHQSGRTYSHIQYNINTRLKAESSRF